MEQAEREELTLEIVILLERETDDIGDVDKVLELIRQYYVLKMIRESEGE